VQGKRRSTERFSKKGEAIAKAFEGGHSVFKKTGRKRAIVRNSGGENRKNSQQRRAGQREGVGEKKKVATINSGRWFWG